jgi:hypothetical protein
MERSLIVKVLTIHLTIHNMVKQTTRVRRQRLLVSWMTRAFVGCRGEHGLEKGN